MLLRALRPFTSHPAVAAVAVVLPAADVGRPPAFLSDVRTDRVRLAQGGATRGQSVAQGLEALPPGLAVVLVHDAARPFVSRDIIDAVIVAARDGCGAVPALPVSDTLRRWTGGEVPPRIVDRADLWRSQTPQGFPAERFRMVCRAAVAASATDDAALWESAGERLRLVPGRTTNIKVTTPEDFALAEALAAVLP